MSVSAQAVFVKVFVQVGQVITEVGDCFVVVRIDVAFRAVRFHEAVEFQGFCDLVVQGVVCGYVLLIVVVI